MWDWIWIDGEDGEDNESDESVPQHIDVELSESSEQEDSDADAVPSITHSVIFKCIGQLKEHRYQELLAIANKKIKQGEVVPVKLQKEPENPYDTKAIAFVCKAETTFERIGYVVKEALPDVHKAMDENKVLQVQFDHIKFIVHYKSPGWYAGITITRNGEWSNTVLRSQSTH